MEPKSQVNQKNLKGYIVYSGSTRAGELPYKAIYLDNKNTLNLQYPFNAIEQEQISEVKKIIGDKSAVYFPSFSKDMSKITFLITKGTTIRPRINSMTGTLCIANFNNGIDIKEVANNLPIDYFNAPNWSPDGNKIVYRKNEQDICIFNLANGKSIELCKGLMPIWNSADEESIAYVNINNVNVVEIINISTPNKKNIYKAKGAIASLAWSPDGQYIAIAEQAFKTIRLIIVDKNLKSKYDVGVLGFPNLTTNILWKVDDKK